MLVLYVVFCKVSSLLPAFFPFWGYFTFYYLVVVLYISGIPLFWQIYFAHIFSKSEALLIVSLMVSLGKHFFILRKLNVLVLFFLYGYCFCDLRNVCLVYNITLCFPLMASWFGLLHLDL